MLSKALTPALLAPIHHNHTVTRQLPSVLRLLLQAAHPVARGKEKEGVPQVDLRRACFWSRERTPRPKAHAPGTTPLHTPPARKPPSTPPEHLPAAIRATHTGTRPQRKRGRRGGVRERLRRRNNRPPLPSIILSNVRSLTPKLDELRVNLKSCFFHGVHRDVASPRRPGFPAQPGRILTRASRPLRRSTVVTWVTGCFHQPYLLCARVFYTC